MSADLAVSIRPAVNLIVKVSPDLLYFKPVKVASPLASVMAVLPATIEPVPSTKTAVTVTPGILALVSSLTFIIGCVCNASSTVPFVLAGACTTVIVVITGGGTAFAISAKAKDRKQKLKIAIEAMIFL